MTGEMTAKDRDALIRFARAQARQAEREVEQAYCRLGLRRVRTKSRAGWVALVLRASW